jgi:hypothetical protein
VTAGKKGLSQVAPGVLEGSITTRRIAELKALGVGIQKSKVSREEIQLKCSVFKQKEKLLYCPA